MTLEKDLMANQLRDLIKINEKVNQERVIMLR